MSSGSDVASLESDVEMEPESETEQEQEEHSEEPQPDLAEQPESGEERESKSDQEESEKSEEEQELDQQESEKSEEEQESENEEQELESPEQELESPEQELEREREKPEKEQKQESEEQESVGENAEGRMEMPSCMESEAMELDMLPFLGQPLSSSRRSSQFYLGSETSSQELFPHILLDPPQEEFWPSQMMWEPQMMYEPQYPSQGLGPQIAFPLHAMPWAQGMPRFSSRKRSLSEPSMGRTMSQSHSFSSHWMMSPSSLSSSFSEVPSFSGVHVLRQAEVEADPDRLSEEPEIKIESYAMAEKKGEKHGLMLILEFEDFKEKLSKRTGSHKDVENLRKLFRQLRFDVVVMRNLTHIDLLQALDDFARDERHKEGYMMVMAILSHGANGCIFTSDEKEVNTESEILERFNNKNCPLLKGKPKFFIIQACRGLKRDYGLRDIARPKEVCGQSGDAIGFNLPVDPVVKANPTWEDMIIAYSTIPNYISMRDHDQGTWFIQSLVAVFQRWAFKFELNDLLRLTAKELSKLTCKDTQKKQTCNVEVRHLYKKIYFRP